MKLTDEEKEIIIKLVKTKMEKTDWVLQNKEPDNPQVLTKKMGLYEGILKKLEEEE